MIKTYQLSLQSAEGKEKVIDLPNLNNPLSEFIHHAERPDPEFMQDDFEGDKETASLLYLMGEVKYWLDLTDDEVRAMPFDSLIELKAAIDNGINPDNHEPQQRRVFRHKNDNWYLPVQDMKGSPFIDYLEIAQLKHMSTDISMLPRMIALLCRKEGEKLPLDPNELDEFLDRRQSIFESLPMHIVLDVSFFLLKQNVFCLKNGINTYQSPQPIKISEKKQTTFGKRMVGIRHLTALWSQAFSKHPD